MDKPGLEPRNVGCLIAHLAIKGWISFILPLCMEKPTINRAFSVYRFRHLSVLPAISSQTSRQVNKVTYHVSFDDNLRKEFQGNTGTLIHAQLRNIPQHHRPCDESPNYKSFHILGTCAVTDSNLSFNLFPVGVILQALPVFRRSPLLVC